MNPDPLPADPENRSIPGLRERIWFFVRVQILRVMRGGLRARLPRLTRAKDLRETYPFELAFSSSALRTSAEPAERRLMLGKIENLRQACRRINGTVLGPGEVFSFWKELGPAWKSRGFVPGREIREGCIIPSTGGGLCQFSGALHEAAVAAGLTVLERHRHTARFDEAPYRPERDATVFWNYVDLRFRAPLDAAVAIEARLTPDELIIKVRGRSASSSKKPTSIRELTPEPASTENCMTCGEEACARHLGARALAFNNDGHMKTAALLDAVEPEFESYLSGELIDLYLLPAPIARYKWYVPATATRRFVWWQALVRALILRSGARRGKIAAALRMQAAERIAKAYARRIPYDVEHLIVTQDFLPFLWLSGALGGRTFDVLLTRPPLAVVHERLDSALKRMPRQVALSEFRAPREIVAAESEAFVYADKVVTPHAEYAGEFPNLRKLEWQAPEVVPPADVRNPTYLLFPASLAAREGAHAALGTAEALGLPLLVAGRDLEGIAAESDAVRFTRASEIPWHEVAAVVHPALFESWPRLHLHALALGIPVLASSACGLEEGGGVTVVPFDDEPALIRALERVLRGFEMPGAEHFSRSDEMVP